MRHLIFASILATFSTNLLADVVPLGDTDGFVLLNTEVQLPFTLDEGTFVECKLDTGMPNLKIETCKIENGSFNLNGKVHTLTHLVRNFQPNVGGTPLYQYQYVGIWEQLLPNFTLRFKMTVTINANGLNVPRMVGFIQINELQYTHQLVAKKT